MKSISSRRASCLWLFLIGLGLVLVPASAAGDEPVPRPEHPRPDMFRADWINLNGSWDFAFDLSSSGEERGLPEGRGFDRTITVPFAPESSLSGVGFKDFMPVVWYKRTVTFPDTWCGKRLLLHFEACDYLTTVWVNGRKAGSHEGGYTPFTFDITRLFVPGPNLIVVRAADDTRSGRQPIGKQSRRYDSYGCVYRRTTGIWQTVWAESVPAVHIEDYHVSTGPATSAAAETLVTVFLSRAPEAGQVTLAVTSAGRKVFQETKPAERILNFLVRIKHPRLWDVRQPNLYDLDITMTGSPYGDDRVQGSLGIRSFEVSGGRFLLNGRPLFLRTVLDQGFYPDGIYTAPSDEALQADIEMAQRLGFDGARLHQRVFERRFLYWADQLGYLVWGEFADWGLDLTRPDAFLRFVPQWAEAMARDIHHPCLIGWCPLNERWGDHAPDVIERIFELTKRLDLSRPVIDASGGDHPLPPDVFDSHNYDQNPVSFKAAFDGLLLAPPKVYLNGRPEQNAPYAGQPYFVSEYGGIWWNPGQEGDKAWGYGERPKTPDEFLARYKALTEALLFNPAVAGFCYTQLYDIEQEVNGLLTFARRAKFDPAFFFKVNQQKAACEK